MADYRTYENVPRFQLDRRPGRSRMKLRCPSCGGERCLTPYIDTVTGQPVGVEFGRCDHERRCGYDRRPTGSDVGDKPIWVSGNDVLSTYKPPLRPDIINYIPDSEWLLTVHPTRLYNTMFSFLSEYWNYYMVDSVLRRYNVGSMNLWGWKGCSVFWQIDRNFVCRTGKIMEYRIVNDEEGIPVDIKRVKGEDGGYPHVMFYHAMKGQNFLFRQCLFGEHLLNFCSESETIHLVEAEKTAIICTLGNPNKIFMATGGLQNLRTEVMEPLRGRKIIAYPDKGSGFDVWKEKIEKNLFGFDIEISDFLQNNESVPDGGDMADYIIMNKVNKSKKEEIKNGRKDDK